jgi:hypothetical protein
MVDAIFDMAAKLTADNLLEFGKVLNVKKKNKT